MLEDSKPADQSLQIPDQHWQAIMDRDLDDLARCAGGAAVGNTLELEMLGRTLRIDLTSQLVEIAKQGTWLPAPPLPAFVTVVHLANCRMIPLSGRWVSEKDLSCREFFRGPHQLRLEPVLEKYGRDGSGFLAAAQAYGGVEIDEAGDAAVRLWVVPTIPVKLVLWCADEELGPALTVLFDQSIDMLLPGDGIWALVQMVGEVLAHQNL